MPMTEISFPGARPIDGYGPGFFRIGGKRHDGAVLVTAEGAAGWGGYADTGALRALAGRIDVLLVGTGPGTGYLPAEFMASLHAVGLAPDPMSSAAAARTYNMLLAEGRRVAAALLPALAD